MSEYIVEGEYDSDSSNSKSVKASYFGGAKSDASDSEPANVDMDSESESSDLYNSDCSGSDEEECANIPFDGSFTDSDQDVEEQLGRAYIGLSDVGDVVDNVANAKKVGGAKNKEKIHEALLELTDLGDIKEISGGRPDNIKTDDTDGASDEESPFLIKDEPAYENINADTEADAIADTEAVSADANANDDVVADTDSDADAEAVNTNTDADANVDAVESYIEDTEPNELNNSTDDDLQSDLIDVTNETGEEMLADTNEKTGGRSDDLSSALEQFLHNVEGLK